MILEAAAWILGALIGHAVGLVFGYRMGFAACDGTIRDRQRRARQRRRRRA